MDPSDNLSSETIERLKRRYEESDEKLVAIAAEEGIAPARLQALRREYGWRARSARTPKSKEISRKVERSATRKATRKTPARRKTGTGAKRAASSKRSKPPRRATARPPGVVDVPTLIVRIRAQLEGALESAQTRGPKADPDETARLMNSLTRTLQMLRALEKDTDRNERRDDGSDAPPLDLAELRRELARRIDQLRQDRESA